MIERTHSHPGGTAVPADVVTVFALVALVAIEIFVTYSRLPAASLYHVSREGVAGGAGRILVFLNWPTALIAIAVLLLLIDRFSGRLPRPAAVVGIGLCAVIFWPGVVRQSDLDARWVNLPAAVGVGLAVALSLLAWRDGALPRRALGRGDRVRLGIAVAVIVLAIPWIAADLGFYLDGVPGLEWLFQTGDLRVQPGDAVPHPAVHHGHHHGMDGALLVLVVLLLSRQLATMRRRGLRSLLAAYLALMLTYGLGNVANDAWLEQVVKRGWTDWEIPDVTEPRLSIAWAIIAVSTAAIWAVWRMRPSPR